MKNFAKAGKDFGTKPGERFKKAADDFMKVMQDPHPTQADCDRVWQEFVAACEETNTTAVEAARGEFKEHVLKNLDGIGMSRKDAERLFSRKWADVERLSEKVAKSAPKTTAAARALWLKVAGVLAAVGVAAFAVRTGRDAGGALTSHVSGVDAQSDAARLTARISLSQAQYQRLLEELKLVDLPEAPKTASVPSPILSLPPAVAAAAATPVTARAVVNGTARTATTNLGQVWQLLPASRGDIESAVGSGDASHIHGTIKVDDPFGQVPGLSLNF